MVNEEPWRGAGVRVKVVKNYLIYFWIDEPEMIVQGFCHHLCETGSGQDPFAAGYVIRDSSPIGGAVVRLFPFLVQKSGGRFHDLP